MKCVAACALILLLALYIMSRADSITFPIYRGACAVVPYASCPAGYSFECPAPLSSGSVCSSAAHKVQSARHGARDTVDFDADPLKYSHSGPKCSRTKDTPDTHMCPGTTCFLGLLLGFVEEEVH